MIGMLSSGRECVSGQASGQGHPGALRIPGESGSSIRTSSRLSTEVELAVRVVAMGVLFRVSGGGGVDGEDCEVPLRRM